MAADPVVRNSVAVADPNIPANVIKPNADGSINVDITGSGTGHVIVDSGTLTTVSTVTAVTAITNALPAGTNVIGHVIVDSGAILIVGSTNIVTGQISVATTAGGTLIAAARTGRLDITIVNSGTADVYLGPSGLTTSTGILLKGIPGAALTISTAAAVYGIVAAATQTVSYLETY